jgi:hypothetical protein
VQEYKSRAGHCAVVVWLDYLVGRERVCDGEARWS